MLSEGHHKLHPSLVLHKMSDKANVISKNNTENLDPKLLEKATKTKGGKRSLKEPKRVKKSLKKPKEAPKSTEEPKVIQRCPQCAIFEGKTEPPYGGFCDDPDGGRYFAVPSIHEILQRPIVGRKKYFNFEMYFEKK